jgi:hypothetical protein
LARQLLTIPPERRCAATHGAQARIARTSQMVPASLDTKGTQILAKSLFRELRGSGYSPNQILSLSTELIDLVTQDIKVKTTQPSDEAAKGSTAVS